MTSPIWNCARLRSRPLAKSSRPSTTPGFPSPQATTRHYELTHGKAALLIEPLLPPIALYLFGAGYDAVPLAQLAGELGWRVTVADHRPSYARAERFPSARQVLLAQPGHLPEELQFDNRSCAVIMSHNYLQDQASVAGLARRSPRLLGRPRPASAHPASARRFAKRRYRAKR